MLFIKDKHDKKLESKRCKDVFSNRIHERVQKLYWNPFIRIFSELLDKITTPSSYPLKDLGFYSKKKPIPLMNKYFVLNHPLKS